MKKIISGKVREVYDLEDGRMVIVTTDRISAFDVILPTMITDKGKVLNALSNFWFGLTKDIVKNHMISSDLKDMPAEFQKSEYEGRTILVKKLKMIPYEVIVRGYMFGSMYEAYKKGEPFLGHSFDKKYEQAEKLEEPIVTPSTKAAEGHDINVTFDYMKKDLGEELATKIQNAALAIYKKCYDHAYKNGIIIADTKFEFGLDENGELVLGDEVLTPDSSRFWNLDTYKTGTSPASYDKQFVRDWLKDNNLAGDPNIKSIPEDVVAKTSALYHECVKKITGKDL
ncbi:phosphoribosylaminoimidazolesuccinocarboxamide synthase [Treponema rectale]|uniref:Phosphoribosylaminoimidazole-succinocarboxamide synthase n=1 Tax=Treponema rectale TaxID=744512 RepID=A0A840SJF9_9SPIR|nr:phosphoribosylaminoimidazolesuccinocarboxamide synthase [Treponema rectale]MBB5220026.1 phosphoribosylaminoimidazole-succinocarboxamide synthase [Treponema rectale]QOS40658.1 phosphoribosylaminoimidazolesuccinocarboxamide synthase [Treponema rectale]